MNNRRCRPSHRPREYYLVMEHKQCNQTTLKNSEPLQNYGPKKKKIPPKRAKVEMGIKINK